MKIFVINGYPRSGKDEFVHLFKSISKKKVINLSTIDPIKDAAIVLGWNSTKKTPEMRRFLSDLKDLATKYLNTSIKYIKERVKDYSLTTDYCFIHCREPEEIEKLVNELGAETIYIDASQRLTLDFSNHADREVENYHYDYYIDNNKSIIEFTNNIQVFWDDINETIS